VLTYGRLETKETTWGLFMNLDLTCRKSANKPATLDDNFGKQRALDFCMPVKSLKCQGSWVLIYEKFDLIFDALMSKAYSFIAFIIISNGRIVKLNKCCKKVMKPLVSFGYSNDFLMVTLKSLSINNTMLSLDKGLEVATGGGRGGGGGGIGGRGTGTLLLLALLEG
jgi:hypothetical protein